MRLSVSGRHPTHGRRGHWGLRGSLGLETDTRGLALAGCPEEAVAQAIEMRPAKHLPFHHLEAIDMAFDGSAAPGAGETGFDGRIVALETGGYALKRDERTRGCLL